MSLLYRALKKAEDKDNQSSPESTPQLLAEDAAKPPRKAASLTALLAGLLVLTAAVIGGVMFLPEIEDLLVPRAVPITPAGPTAEQRAAEAARIAEEQRIAEDAQKVEEARIAEETRLAEEQRLADRAAQVAAEQEASLAARREFAEQTRLAEEAKAAARAELERINQAVEAARQEREALEIAQSLARERAATDAANAAAAAREAEAAARATVAALRDEIAKQQALLAQVPEVPTPAPQAAPEPQAAPTPMVAAPVENADGSVNFDALIARQSGEPAPVAPAGPITIERESGSETTGLEGLITVIDESDYFRDRYDAARGSLNAGGARSALAIYDELLTRQPNDRVALLGRATALHQLNRSADAIRAYETALRRHPDELTALTNLLGLIGRQTPKAALQQLGRLYESNPGLDAVAAQMSMIHLKLGDSAQAIRLMAEAAALAADNPVYQINLAIMHDRAGDAAAAVSAYERALIVAAGSAEALPLSVDAIRERLRYLRAN